MIYYIENEKPFPMDSLSYLPVSAKNRDILTNFFLNIADRTEKSGSAVIGRAGSWFIVRLSDNQYMVPSR